MLSQEEIAHVPGSVVWQDLEDSEFVSDPFFTFLLTRGEHQFGTNVVQSIRVSGEGQGAEDPVISFAFQDILQFETQAEATQFMERLRGAGYQLLDFVDVTAGGNFLPGLGDVEAWLQELEPSIVGPGAFAVESHSVISALVQRELGFGGRFQDTFQGWFRYGNLVSFIFVSRGIDIFGVLGPMGDQEAIKGFLSTRSGAFYTMEEFQEVLRAAYQGLKEGSLRPSLENDLLEPTPTSRA